MAGAVLMGLGGVMEVVGAVVGIALFFSWKQTLEVACGAIGGGTLTAAQQTCVDLSVGFVAWLMWPSVVISIVAGLIMFVAAFMSYKARNALLAKLNPTA